MGKDAMQVPIPDERWKELEPKTVTWMMWEMLRSIDKRLEGVERKMGNLESKQSFNDRMITLGSLVGGALGGIAAGFAAIFGLRLK